MPKVKVKRKSTFIDMTAMSDVTVLLLTFFMLTSTFIKKEPVQVSTPASVSEIKIPEINVLSILIEPTGKVFMSLDKQEDKIQVLKKVGENYKIEFTDKELYKFSLLPSFGVPIDGMKKFLELSGEQQDEILKNYGIPTDSIDNQFKHWVRSAKEVNKDLLIAIKADAKTPYPVIKGVMTSLQELRENRYNLITSLKTGAGSEPTGTSHH
jgi:biopolymer transport protein ExbD